VAELSEKIVEITGRESNDELRRKLKENFDMLQRLIDGLTGQRLEDWTPIRRDGSVAMTGNLNLEGGSVTLKSADGTSEISLRRGGDGTLEHRDAVDANFTPIYDPEYKDVTSSRALDVVYKNKNKHRSCQITLKLEP
jgi:hypothetical protein